MTANSTSKLIHDLLTIYNSNAETLGIIPWSSPIPVFGDFREAKVATIGINPSNREFTCSRNEELHGEARRFPTLSSFDIPSWNEVTHEQIEEIVKACTNYFSGSSYDLWFKKLDSIIKGSGSSFYKLESPACHLDLVPWATMEKWSFLDASSKKVLFEQGANFLSRIIEESPIQVLILNGSTVINGVLGVSESEFSRRKMPSWTLPRKNSDGVMGYAYEGTISAIGGKRLSKTLKFLGFNHNLQSSFGVTKKVQTSIAGWISKNTRYLD